MKMGDVRAHDPSREDHDATGQRPGAGDGTPEQRAPAEALLLLRQLGFVGVFDLFLAFVRDIAGFHRNRVGVVCLA